jgi:hypothetical protein
MAKVSQDVDPAARGRQAAALRVRWPHSAWDGKLHALPIHDSQHGRWPTPATTQAVSRDHRRRHRVRRSRQNRSTKVCRGTVSNACRHCLSMRDPGHGRLADRGPHNRFQLRPGNSHAEVPFTGKLPNGLYKPDSTCCA